MQPAYPPTYLLYLGISTSLRPIQYIAMACDVEQWRDSVLMEEETAPDRPYTPILALFTTASSLYGLLLECVEGLLPTPDIRRLERERDRLRLWADGYGVVSGNLDHVLADTRRMRHSTICLLVSICRTLVKGLSSHSAHVRFLGPSWHLKRKFTNR